VTRERRGMPPSGEGETRSAYVVQRHFPRVRKGYDPAGLIATSSSKPRQLAAAWPARWTKTLRLSS
jgi:hypothetical protein